MLRGVFVFSYSSRGICVERASVDIVAAVRFVFFKSVPGHPEGGQNRSLTSTSTTKDFLGPSDDIWGVQGRRFRLIRGASPEGSFGMNHHCNL